MLDRPIFFSPNRVWRCYRGGLLLDAFTGASTPADSHFPEEWIASTTRAQNGLNQSRPDEGISFARGCSLSLLSILPEPLPVLCKFLDSAERLPIQCHPDREFAKIHYKSNVGKAESWFILGTREISCEKPYILMGFTEDADPAGFREAVKKQDIETLTKMLHRVEVKTGDAFFIPGRLPHAIGPGVFMLEVQPERFIGDTRLSDTDMWGPLDVETGLDCFDFSGRAYVSRILDRVRLTPYPIDSPSPSVFNERFIDRDQSGSFIVDRFAFAGAFNLTCLDAHSIVVVVSGAATVGCGGETFSIRQGGCFLIPRSSSPEFYSEKGSVCFRISA